MLKFTNIKSKCEFGLADWLEISPFNKFFIYGVINDMNFDLI